MNRTRSDTMTNDPIGSRVAVRIRIGTHQTDPGRPGPSQTDVVGRLVGADAASLLVERDTPARFTNPVPGETGPGESGPGDSGRTVRIERSRVVALRVIPERPVRRSEVRALEGALARTWPGTEQESVAGWWCRAGAGITRRANSAVSLSPDAALDEHARAAVAAWYRSRGLTPTLAVVGRLHPQFTDTAALRYPTLVMTRGADEAPLATESEIDPVIGAEPYRAVAQRSRGLTSPAAASDGLWREVTAGVDSTIEFLTLGPGATGGARVAIDQQSGWGTIAGLWVAPEERGRGLGRALTVAAMRWALANGATGLALQVETNNPARRLYDELGFTAHHEYGYLELPR